jgi:hypothetical protein
MQHLLVIIVLISLLISCTTQPQSSEGVALPTAQIADVEDTRNQESSITDEPDTPSPTITIAVDPTAEPTRTPLSSASLEQIEETYKALVLVQATAEVLNETAKRVQSGELEGFESFGALIAVGAVAAAVTEFLPQVSPPDYLVSEVRAARSLNDDVRTLLGRWFDREINSATVLEEMVPLLTEVDSIIQGAEEKLAREAGLSAQSLTQARQDAMAAVSEVFESTPDTAVEEGIEPQEPPEGDKIALNYVAEQDSEGVVVQIGRVLVGDKEYVQATTSNSYDADIFADKDVVAMLIFSITNNTDKTVTINPFMGSVQINTEQIDLFDYSIRNFTFGDQLSGEIFPGVTKIGGIWFGIRRSQLEDIQDMTVRIEAPRDASDFSRLGPDYELRIDLSRRVFEELPADLR